MNTGTEFGITIDGMSFSYEKSRRRPLLDEISLRLPHSGLFGLIGRNGAGKTTLFDLILGYLSPTSGGITNTFPRDDIAHMPQSIAAPWLLTCSEIISFVAALEGVPGDEMQCRFLELLSVQERHRYESMSSKRFGRCSIGERRWFMTILILLHERRCYLLDEPTAGVDPEFRHLIWEQIGRIAGRGKLVIVSTHLLDEVGRYTSRFMMIAQRRVSIWENMETLQSSFHASSPEEAFSKAHAEAV